MCNLLISTEESDVKPTIEDLADVELQQKLKEILRLDYPFAAIVDLDERYNAGIPCINSLRSIRPQDFVEICSYKVLDVNHKEIEQMKLGLQLNNVLPIMSKFKKDALWEKCFCKRLSASENQRTFYDILLQRASNKSKRRRCNL